MLITEAISHCPEDVRLRLALARIEEKRKGLNEARSILLPLHKHNDVELLRAVGKIDFRMRRFDSGRVFFRRAADLESVSVAKPEAEKSHFQIRTVKSLHAWAHMEAWSSHTDNARALLKEAVSICDSDSGVWRAIAEIESRNRNYDKARIAFEKALSIQPRDARVILAYGRTEALAGNLKHAEELFDTVSKITSKHDKVVIDNMKRRRYTTHDIGETTSNANIRPFAKRGVYRYMTFSQRVIANTLKETAMLAAREGQMEDSVSMLTHAAEIDPSSDIVWRLLAGNTTSLHGIQRAREVYEKALGKVDTGKIPKMHHWWGQDERACGNISAARDLFLKASVSHPGYMSVWISWGLLEKSEGNIDKAVSEGVRTKPLRSTVVAFVWLLSLVPFLEGLGQLEHRRGNHGKARQLFQKATLAEPGICVAWLGSIANVAMQLSASA